MRWEVASADEWDRIIDPLVLIDTLENQFRAHQRRGGRRKVRLLACAVARSGNDVLLTPTTDLIEPLEAVADGLAPTTAVTRFDETAGQRAGVAEQTLANWERANRGQPRPADLIREDLLARSVTCLTASRPNLHYPGRLSICISGLRGLDAGVYGSRAVVPYQERTDRHYARFIHCLFGNPFRPVAFDPAWRTSDAVALARGIYDDRAFDRMPILADALQEAGCDNDDILNHCRDTETPHARGCWVVDWLLERM